MERRELLERAAQRGKYAPLYRHLAKLPGKEWRASFSEIEKILGFDLPDSARTYRPWWANQGQQGHSQALAWEMAGWKTSQVDMVGENLSFVKGKEAASGAAVSAATASLRRTPFNRMLSHIRGSR